MPVTPSGVHIDEYLSSVSQNYINEQTGFIATQVFPVVPVSKQTDNYLVWPRIDWMRDRAQKRGPATESEGGSFTWSEDAYRADVWAWHHDLDDQTLANADEVLNIETKAAQLVQRVLLNRLEYQWFTDFFKAGVWGNDLTVDASWFDVTSNPIGEIEDQKDAIFDDTGYEPNTLVLSRPAYRAIREHPMVVDRMKYTTAEQLTPGMLASMLDLDRVLVARQQKVTSVEGETDVIATQAGTGALLVYTPAAAGRDVAAAGYTFMWDGVSDGIGTTVGTVRIEIPERRVVRIESQQAFANKVVGAAFGAYFTGAGVAV